MPVKRPGDELEHVHVRLDPDVWQALRLWSTGGVVRVSATTIASTLIKEFHDTVIKGGEEPSYEVIVSGIKNAVRTGGQKLLAERSGQK